MLIKDCKFKEAQEEFEKCLARVKVSRPSLAAACYRELAVVTVLGAYGKLFTVGQVRSYVSKAQEYAAKESQLWGEVSIPSATQTQISLLISKLDQLDLMDDRRVLSTGYTNLNGLLSMPLKVVEESGPACASCQLAFSPMMRCSRCKSTEYFVCGVACQRKDWARHKVVCGSK